MLCLIDRSLKMDSGNERSLMNDTETVSDEVGSSFYIDQPGQPKNMQLHSIAVETSNHV